MRLFFMGTAAMVVACGALVACGDDGDGTTGTGGSSTGKASGGKEDGRQQRCSIFLEPEEMEAAKVIAAKEAIGEGF